MVNVTLHVSVWVEMLRYYIQAQWRGCHAPRERVSWNAPGATSVPLRTRSRSTWACELKCERSEQGRLPFRRHAPRERVSWNVRYRSFFLFCLVTLHVSVWVEINEGPIAEFDTESRSTWACELKFNFKYLGVFGTTSRSTWACELKSSTASTWWKHRTSRSTWACELKFSLELIADTVPLVTLHVSVWVEIYRGIEVTHNLESRSTWACELKSHVLPYT